MDNDTIEQFSSPPAQRRGSNRSNRARPQSSSARDRTQPYPPPHTQAPTNETNAGQSSSSSLNRARSVERIPNSPLTQASSQLSLLAESDQDPNDPLEILEHFHLSNIKYTYRFYGTDDPLLPFLAMDDPANLQPNAILEQNTRDFNQAAIKFFKSIDLLEEYPICRVIVKTAADSFARKISSHNNAIDKFLLNKTAYDNKQPPEKYVVKLEREKLNTNELTLPIKLEYIKEDMEKTSIIIAKLKIDINDTIPNLLKECDSIIYSAYSNTKRHFLAFNSPKNPIIELLLLETSKKLAMFAYNRTMQEQAKTKKKEEREKFKAENLRKAQEAAAKKITSGEDKQIDPEKIYRMINNVGRRVTALTKRQNAKQGNGRGVLKSQNTPNPRAQQTKNSQQNKNMKRTTPNRRAPPTKQGYTRPNTSTRNFSQRPPTIRNQNRGRGRPRRINFGLSRFQTPTINFNAQNQEQSEILEQNPTARTTNRRGQRAKRGQTRGRGSYRGRGSINTRNR
jgi:hypothetical protein